MTILPLSTNLHPQKKEKKKKKKEEGILTVAK